MLVGFGFPESPKCNSSQQRGQSLEQRLQIRGLWAWLGLMVYIMWFKQYFFSSI